MENFSPNQTKFTVQRADPVSRYRFTLSARTQVGSGEAVTEESPAPPNEGRCMAAASGVKGPHSFRRLEKHTHVASWLPASWGAEAMWLEVLQPSKGENPSCMLRGRFWRCVWKTQIFLDLQSDLSSHFALTCSAATHLSSFLLVGA